MNQAPALADVIDILTKFVCPAAMAAQDQQHFAHFWDTEALIWVANGIKE